MLRDGTWRWAAVACVGLLSAPSSAVCEGPPLRSTFDLSSAVPPAGRKAAEARLRAALVDDLRGGDDSVGELRLAAAFVRGRLTCRVFLSHAGGRRALIGQRCVPTVADLAGVANALARSQRLWVGRLVAAVPGSNDRNWTARSLTAHPAPPAMMALAGVEGSVWKLQPGAPVTPAGQGAAGQFVVRRLEGPSGRADQVLAPVLLAKGGARIELTVVRSDGVPLRDMQIYAQANQQVDSNPVHLWQREPVVKETDADGKGNFRWDHAGEVYLLIARDGVPLARAVAAPAGKVHRQTVRIGSRWTLVVNGQPKEVSLGVYVLEKRKEIERKIREYKGREAVLAQVKGLIDRGELAKARDLIERELPPGSSLRKELIEQIDEKLIAVELAPLLREVRLAEVVKDYDKAARYLRRALAVAGADGKAELERRLKQMEAAAADLRKRVDPARRVVAASAAQTAAQIADGIGKIEQAVAALCSVGQVSSMAEANRNLDAALKTLSKKTEADIEKIKKGLMTKEDPLFKKLPEVRQRILQCQKRILQAHERATQAVKRMALPE